MLNFIKKIFSIFSIFLIFNLTFVNSAQAGPTNVTTASVGTGGSATAIKPQAIAFNGNGEKMFVLHNRTPSSGAFSNFDRVEEYDLGTGFDISASSFGSKQEHETISGQETAPRGFAFNNNGTKMFVVGETGRDVNEYTISSGFDLSSSSTITFVDSKDISGQDTKPEGLAFNNDGTKMFVVGDNDNDINEYTLSTAFDVSSASFVDGNGDGTGFSVASQTSTPSGIAFNNDGTKMFVTDRGGADVHSYDLDAPFDIGFTDPILTSSVPADDATDVERDANIILNFSENVDAESGNITIHKTSDDSEVETIGVTSSQVTGSGTSQITINPGTDFDNNTEYYVLIPDTAFDNSSSGSYVGISSTTALSFTIKAMVDPTTDKDVTGTIDAQNMMAKNTLTEFTSIVNDRLRYLRQNRINKDFTKNNIKLDFGNAMLTSLAKFIPASKIHLTNEILTSLAIDIPTSKTYLTNTMLTSLAKVTPVSNISIPDLIPENWSSWSEGSVSMTKVGDSKNSSSKEIDVQSLALGFDKKLNNNDLLGFAMQFSQSDSEVGTSGTGIDSKNYNLSVYGTRPLNDDNFVEGLFGVVLTENELVRKSGANTLTGSRNGTQIFGSINYGKTIDKEDFNLTPIARVDLGYTELDAYSESGTDALTYGKQTVETGLVSIGLEINDNIKFSNSSLQPFGSFQYGLDFSNSSDTKINYVSDTSTIYTYTPGINSTHLLTAEVGFNYELQDHLKLIGIFKRIQGSGSQQTNHMRFGFHYISQRETEYAMSLDGSDELMTGLNISKNINGFDIKLGSNYSLMSEVPDYGVNLKISNKF